MFRIREPFKDTVHQMHFLQHELKGQKMAENPGRIAIRETN
jgi:hypothetical protein